MSDEPIVCMDCGSDDVERAVWTKINSDEFVDEVEDHEHYCARCGDECSTALRRYFEEHVLKRWRGVAEKANVDVEVTLDIAERAQIGSIESCVELREVDHLLFAIRASKKAPSPIRQGAKEEERICTYGEWQRLSMQYNGGLSVHHEIIKRAKELYAESVFNRYDKRIIREAMKWSIRSALCEYNAGIVAMRERPSPNVQSVTKDQLSRVLNPPINEDEVGIRGMHPSTVNWSSLEETKSRGFPIGESTLPVENFTKLEERIHPFCYAPSDILGSFAYSQPSILGADCFFTNNISLGIKQNNREKVRSPSSPIPSLSDWIRKPNSTALDRDD